MKLCEVAIARDLTWGKELPNQLIVRGGKIVMINGGEEARFGLMEGMEVNVVPHADLVVALDYAELWKRGGGAA